MKRHHWYIVGGAVVALSAGASLYHTPKVAPVTPVTPAPIIQIPAVAYNPVSKRLGPDDIYPPSWATGAIDPDTTNNPQGTICNKSWSTKSIRPPATYTTNLKIQQLKQLGYADQNTKDYEEDHLISLELGGNPTDPKNLWPESYKASIPDGGAKKKDLVENYLHARVCAGKITLQEAQSAIVADWYKVYKDDGL